MNPLLEDKHKKNAILYSIIGFGIGLIFPIAGTIVITREFSGSYGLNSLIQLHIDNPLLQIIDLAPFILLCAGLIFGVSIDNKFIALIESTEKKFKNLIEDAAEVIYITDYKGNFVYFNRRLETVYGYKPEEMIGAHFTILVNPSMAKKVADFYKIQFEKKIAETISDFQIIDKSGNLRWVEQTVILRMKGDRVEGFQSIVRDIDHRIKQEREILNLNDQLKFKLDELESVNQELSAFNHTVSHDLRSPLRGIATLVEIIQMDFESQLPEEAQGILSRIIASTNKVQTLVEDLLEFSKIGRQEIHKEKVNMRELTDQILQEQLSNNLEIKTSVQVDDLADSVCDKQLIRQVWVNFISNALKYSSKKENPVIRIGNYIENLHQIYFIKDNGAGFDMAYYKKLFGVFSRLHSDTEFNGTGVGLSIVKRIIERHNGKVWAEGQPGLGATFYFSLPVIAVDSAAMPIHVDSPVFYG